MDLGSTFLVLAVLILVGMYISRPFFEKKTGSLSEKRKLEDLKEHQRSTLLAERDRLLTALQELDFDNALGKIPEEDYPEQRKLLMLQGVDILKQLDTLQGRAIDETAESRLEAVIAARRADTAQVAVPLTVPAAVSPGRLPREDDEIEQLISNRRQGRKELTSGFCHKCGKPVQKSDVFCPKCGAKLN